MKKTLIICLFCCFVFTGCEKSYQIPDSFYWGFALDGFPIKEDRLESLQRSQNLPVQMVNFYLQWPTVEEKQWSWQETNLKETLNSIHKIGAVPCLTWEPMSYSKGEEQAVSHEKIIEGLYDDYILKIGKVISCFKKPVIVRFAQEMNLERYHWGTSKSAYGSNSPKIYRKMFQYVQKKIRISHATNAFFAFCPNVDSIPNDTWNNIADYYPGSSYVDFVGIDGYNWGKTTKEDDGWNGEWRSFSDIFNNAYHALKKIAAKKPMLIFETASVPGISNQRIEWIKEAIKTGKKWKIHGIFWFQVEKEKDWELTPKEMHELEMLLPADTESFQSAMLQWLIREKRESLKGDCD